MAGSIDEIRREQIEQALREFLKKLQSEDSREEEPEVEESDQAPLEELKQRDEKLTILPSVKAEVPTKQEKVPYFLLPEEKCFICGSKPTAGSLMPTSIVLYFCDEHLETGRELAKSAWEAEKTRQKRREIYQMWEKWRRRILQSMVASASSENEEVGDTCENCGAPVATPIISADGTLIALCPDCAREIATIDPDTASLGLEP